MVEKKSELGQHEFDTICRKSKDSDTIKIRNYVIKGTCICDVINTGNFKSIEFENCMFVNSSFVGLVTIIIAVNCVFKKSTFQNCNLKEGSCISDSRFFKCKLINSFFNGALKKNNFNGNIEGCRFECEISSVVFSETKINDCSFKAKVLNTTFTESKLKICSFFRSQFYFVKFFLTNISLSSIERCDLFDCSFQVSEINSLYIYGSKFLNVSALYSKFTKADISCNGFYEFRVRRCQFNDVLFNNGMHDGLSKTFIVNQSEFLNTDLNVDYFIRFRYINCLSDRLSGNNIKLNKVHFCGIYSYMIDSKSTVSTKDIGELFFENEIIVEPTLKFEEISAATTENNYKNKIIGSIDELLKSIDRHKYDIIFGGLCSISLGGGCKGCIFNNYKEYEYSGCNFYNFHVDISTVLNMTFGSFVDRSDTFFEKFDDISVENYNNSNYLLEVKALLLKIQTEIEDIEEKEFNKMCQMELENNKINFKLPFMDKYIRWSLN